MVKGLKWPERHDASVETVTLIYCQGMVRKVASHERSGVGQADAVLVRELLDCIGPVALFRAR